ncbi:MAG: hypothetical protein UY61_C0051G0007 [Candidatus Adlerbacteria bacterium GW2011_GWC1_50_9]|uniref:Uncharacterized protein n=1 Tax=Candidatus Adlerbacteria bacterium GW2011_GWC1_50_9 TaxID=1618608 RepID=A0A0G1ZK08_9BACT|nr:MAG: hypothetical protein UY61_C0051G0007 [Candidatus Adlerbacteria bacterium GW2011_GWC1_50_9]
MEKKRNTVIFLTLAAGQEIRNILYGDFYSILKARQDVIVLGAYQPVRFLLESGSAI